MFNCWRLEVPLCNLKVWLLKVIMHPSSAFIFVKALVGCSVQYVPTANFCSLYDYSLYKTWKYV